MIITQKNAGSRCHKLLNLKLTTTMKVTTIITTCSAVIVSALLAVSCVKPTGKEVATEQYDYSNKAFVQVYNGTVNTTARNYVYVDGNAVTGAALSYASTFPSTPSNFAITSGVT